MKNMNSIEVEQKIMDNKTNKNNQYNRIMILLTKFLPPDMAVLLAQPPHT